MATSRKPLVAAQREFEVGYGRPPKVSRWRRGQSGNPSGKRKGAKNWVTVLNEMMLQKIPMWENGKRRNISVLEGLLLAQRNSGLKGNLKAAAFLLKQLAATEVAHAAQREVSPRITPDMTPKEAGEIYARALRTLRIAHSKSPQ
jgi:hypothetical protein